MESSIAGNKQMQFNLKAIGSVNQFQKNRIESSLELKMQPKNSRAILPLSNDLQYDYHDNASFDSGT